MQTAVTPAKPENKPAGSANVIYDFKGDGFWMATDEVVDHTASSVQSQTQCWALTIILKACCIVRGRESQMKGNGLGQ
jgi:hypothetical protein